jgi:hypothetical protein
MGAYFCPPRCLLSKNNTARLIDREGLARSQRLQHKMSGKVEWWIGP